MPIIRLLAGVIMTIFKKSNTQVTLKKFESCQKDYMSAKRMMASVPIPTLEFMISSPPRPDVNN